MINQYLGWRQPVFTAVHQELTEFWQLQGPSNFVGKQARNSRRMSQESFTNPAQVLLTTH